MRIALLSVALWLGVAAAAGAQSADADNVRKVDQAWGDAFRTCNLPVMGQVLHDDLVFIVQSGIVHHKQDQLASVGRCDMKQMDVHPERVRVIGDTAIVHGTLDYRLEGPRGGSGRLVYSRTYLKEHGTWQMLQHQSTGAPQPKP